MIVFDFSNFVKYILIITALLRATLSFSQLHEYDTLILLNDDYNAIEFHNDNDQEITFELDLNQVFPQSMKQILENVKRIAEEEECPKYIAAWKYVARTTFHTNPLTESSWQHDPVLFLNSIGGGFCDDKASVLAFLWRYQGYNSRVVLLNGHVVPEIYIQNKWQMYDPSLFVYYEQNGEVLSINELEDNSNVVRYGQLRGQKFAKYYKSKEDNSDITNYTLDTRVRSTTFQLPNKSTLILMNRNGRLYAYIKLSESSQGNFKAPLVPAFADGEIIYSEMYKTDVYKINENESFPKNRSNRRLVIKNVRKETKMFLRTNPMLTVFQPSNHVVVTSSLPIEINRSFVKLTNKELSKIKNYSDFDMTWSKHIKRQSYKSIKRK
jgi:hypothetical protein